LIERDIFERIARTIDAGSRCLRIWPLGGGISSEMIAFEAVTADGATRRFVLRCLSEEALQVDAHATANEFTLLHGLHARGLPVPQPRLLDESRVLVEKPYLVLDYLDGAPSFSPAEPVAFVERFARQLAAIHSTALTPALAFVPQHVPTVQRQRRRDVRDAVMDIAPIRRVLSDGAVLSTTQRVLLHGDFWPGNVLWHDGRVVGVVDWENARIGEPLADLAIARLEILWLLGADAMEALTQHYRSARDVALDALPYWDLDAALRPAFNIADWARGWPAFGRPDVTESTLRAGHAAFVDQALRAIEP